MKAAAGLGFGQAKFFLSDGKDINQFLSAIDPSQLDGVLRPRMAEGSVDDLTDDGVIVDLGEAEDHGIEIGDTIEILFAGGKTTDVTVEAISDEENLLGYYTITRRTYIASVPQPTDFMVFGALDDGAEFEDVQKRIDAIIGDVPTLKVVDREGFIGNIADQIAQFVNFIHDPAGALGDHRHDRHRQHPVAVDLRADAGDGPPPGRRHEPPAAARPRSDGRPS